MSEIKKNVFKIGKGNGNGTKEPIHKSNTPVGGVSTISLDLLNEQFKELKKEFNQRLIEIERKLAWVA